LKSRGEGEGRETSKSNSKTQTGFVPELAEILAGEREPSPRIYGAGDKRKGEEEPEIVISASEPVGRARTEGRGG